MNAGKELIVAAFGEAAKPGAELAPQSLLDVISNYDDPLIGLVGDPGQEMFVAIQGQFPFVNFVRGANKPPIEDQLSCLAALLRWTIRELAEWSEADDPKLKRLTALLVIAWFCETGDIFWNAFPERVVASHDLLTVLERLVSRLNMTLAAPNSVVPSIWEVEAVDAFNRADREGDWVGIDKGWRLIEQSIRPDVIVVHSVRCLSRFGYSHLLQAVQGLRQTVTAMAIMQTLSTTRALEIASATDNSYIQFAAAYQATSSRRGADVIDIAGQDLLTALLVKVADDEMRWAAWMTIFNRIPSWFPALQAPLGHALAVIDDAGVSAYLDTINLNHTGMSHTAAALGRKTVTLCLRAFRNAASAERRKLLWGLAYQRWKDWRFGDGDAADHLVEVCTSDFDYAVAGYASECLDEMARKSFIEDFLQKLNINENAWHTDIVNCMSEWNRILSEYQPFAHAENAKSNGGDWLIEERYYLPFVPQNNRYVLMKYGNTSTRYLKQQT